MKIAQIAPLLESVPPKGYGGTERIASYLTESLVEMGHDVTLFASGDSITRATLVPVVPEALRPAGLGGTWAVWHTLMLHRAMARAGDFDVVHFHTDVLQLPLALRSATPSLTTLHGRLDLSGLAPLYRQFFSHPLVSISQAQRKPLPDANWLATVHHGLPRDLFRYVDVPDDYFVFVGRISPEKRVDRAIEIAIAAGKRLVIGAKVDDVDREYFATRIEPLLAHPLISFIGEVDDARKRDLIGRARALLFPIDWPEPFGLVMIEAFACGTPVIAYDEGSVREVMQDGVTGRIVADQRQAIEAARMIGSIDRRGVRAVFERHYTAQAMATRYLELYATLQPSRARPTPYGSALVVPIRMPFAHPHRPSAGEGSA